MVKVVQLCPVHELEPLTWILAAFIDHHRRAVHVLPLKHDVRVQAAIEGNYFERRLVPVNAILAQGHTHAETAENDDLRFRLRFQ